MLILFSAFICLFVLSSFAKREVKKMIGKVYLEHSSHTALTAKAKTDMILLSHCL